MRDWSAFVPGLCGWSRFGR